MLNISYGRNRGEKNWKPKYGVEWADFVKELRAVRYTDETMREYDAMDNDARSAVKDGPAYVGGEVNGGRRLRESVSSRCLITLDADHVESAEDFLFDVDLNLDGYAYYIYSTHSHRAKKAKFRLVLPMDREASPDEYAAASRKLAAEIGMHYFDHTTFQVHRLMYFPSCSKDAKPVGIEGTGDLISLDGILSRYDNWRDASTWPRAAGEKTYREGVKKMQDPREKEGLIGEFCRQYSITEAIAAFLPDIYEETAHPDRYTYVGASSSAGLIVYDDDTFAYSQHESDPANGRGLNAFDLVRIHLFGDQDADSKESTNHTKLPSYEAMQEFAVKLPGIRSSLIQKRLTAAEDFAEDLKAEGAWQEQLDVDKKTGAILSTANNAELLLRYGEFEGVLGYDAFQNREVIRARLPWRDRRLKHEEYEAWLASDDARLQHHFSKKYDFNTQYLLKNAFTEVVQSKQFHPVKEYLEANAWDGVERLDTLFIDYLGAEDTPYIREVTRKSLTAAVKRIYEPGCKYDTMVVLIGPQGSHKSSLISRLGGPWFNDSLKTFENKEASEQLQGAWIIEIGELAAMKKADVDEIKNFLSKTSDRYRVAYDRVVSDFPRKCVFFGTTNNEDFLKDPTGNRRFWPVKVNPADRLMNHFEHLDDYAISQVWAEALVAYRSGESLLLSPSLQGVLSELHKTHTEADQWEEPIRQFLDIPITEDWDSLDEQQRRQYFYDKPTGTVRRDSITAQEVANECLRKDILSLANWEAKRIHAILRSLPGWEQRDKRGVHSIYGKQFHYDRVV
ncbi:VapE domain-containing protein [Paenibacillus sp. TAB 01]|uniref:VapE domain-containing protein n=1 Tax=Paenibacillus sp. TAB 01 TaxID=3368988 RepID=UPI003753B20D